MFLRPGPCLSATAGPTMAGGGPTTGAISGIGNTGAGCTTGEGTAFYSVKKN